MAAPQRAVQLYGVISIDVAGPTPVRGVSAVTFRDLAALVGETSYAAPSATSQHVT